LVRWFATPFEWDAKRLSQQGARAEWVGHPLLEIVAAAPPRDELRKGFGIKPGQKLVALLPGSRPLELKYNAPHLAQTAAMLQRKSGYEDTLFVIPTPHSVEVPKVFRGLANVIAAPGRATESLLACDAAIVKSGTATLEAAACDTPQIVVYDVPALMKLQWLALGGSKKIPFVAMPNIIAGKSIVPEFLAGNCRSEKLLPALVELLEGDSAREMRENYHTVRRALGEGLAQTATARTVDLIEELVASTSVAA
jgi:lipid-A-disaccharide synthase